MKEDIITKKKSDGKNYTIRKSRLRYFFPEEWNKFILEIKNEKNKLLFNTLIYTGARIMEALNLKASNYNFERGTITFSVVKNRVAKKRTFSGGTERTFFVSQKYLRQAKEYIKKNDVKDNEYLFLDNEKLPMGYDNLSNKEKLKYFNRKKIGYHQMLKRNLKKVGIEDYYNFSLHNIRKTYGMWMRASSDIKIEDLCYRLGHDTQTYMSNYGSNIIFNQSERIKIINFFGEIK